MKIITTLLLLMISAHAYALEYSLLPAPDSLIPAEGIMVLNKKTTIVLMPSEDHRLHRTAVFLQKQLKETTGLKIKIKKAGKKLRRSKNKIILSTHITPRTRELLPASHKSDTPPALGTEGYLMTVSKTALLHGNTAAGVFYAAQSFLQLLAYQDNRWHIPCIAVVDTPRYAIRGQHFDPARQFRDIELLKKYIRILAKYKMNTMHIHFTDDQAWTLESTVYDLTQPGTFYSQAQLRELVAYAKEHFITIIPEIDIPGHCGALRKAHPPIACQAHVKKWSKLICAGKEETYAFFEDIFAELCPIFDGPYFHIGADEVPVNKWKDCRFCSQYITDHSLNGEEGLYFHFINRIHAMLKQHDKRVIIWWEYLPDTIEELSTDIILQKWRRKPHSVIPKTISKGFQIIDSSWHPLYLSHNTDTPEDILAYIPPAVAGYEENTLGIISCSWGDRKEKTEDRVLLPRILAVAEKAWANTTDPNKFTRRMTYHFLDIIEGIPNEEKGTVHTARIAQRLADAFNDSDDPLHFYKDIISAYILKEK